MLIKVGVAVPTGSGVPYIGVALIRKGAKQLIGGGCGGMCPQENFNIYML